MKLITKKTVKIAAIIKPKVYPKTVKNWPS